MGNLLTRKSVKHRDEGGLKALHQAAWDGDLEKCRELVARGTDLEIRDKWGWTAVMEATNGAGHLETVKYLAEAGADIN